MLETHMAKKDVPQGTLALMVLKILDVLAGWIPARRAARVDPLVALRYE
jgi:ABC-type lipoprotein release transport system permease subunit